MLKSANVSFTVSKGNVDLLVYPAGRDGIHVEVGMGGQWWTGESVRRIPDNYVLHNPDENKDSTFSPVMLQVSKLGARGLKFAVSGGLGEEASFVLELRAL
ncbi:hypothetical protein [Candidatus Magnetobacterium casense]|uniref:Uncharacterized protein n=1 Tax=Candidatus Magnetobacterium casense TaxID=1455061 RepID=A0ABS6S4A8_9BACT|nr:hypothetical protein [Candidatus Magnetobacterium casensis]MBV6343671.1 hypothetical protein [Candidatus Magnetobacterium casensis]